MKSVLALTFLAVCAAGAPSEPDIDVDAIFGNTRLYEQYYKCFMDTGKCTAEGREIKEHFPMEIVSECSDCTPKQKEKIKLAVLHMLKEKPKDYEAFEKKWDPEQILRKKYSSK